MPDPLPAFTSSTLSTSTTLSGSRGTGPMLGTHFTPEESPVRNDSWKGAGALGRLNAPRYNVKDDMEVFSPLVDVQPITPSLNKLWDEHGIVKDGEKNPTFSFPSARRFPLLDEGGSDNPSVFDWKPSSVSTQDDIRSLPHLASSAPSQPEASSSLTPTPEAWGGGERFSERAHLRQSSLGLDNLRVRETSKEDTSLGTAVHVPSSSPFFQGNLDSLGPSLLSVPRRLSSYAERISSAPSLSSLSDGTLSVGSPKTKKTGAETRDELLQSLLSRSDVSSSPKATGVFQSMNGDVKTYMKNNTSQSDPQQQGNSFTLQLYQRTLEETLESSHKSIHTAMRDIHIEILRQFHMHEVEVSGVMNTILENQAEIMRELRLLREETQQLRHQLF
ncbi:unnamed protein product [Cuscuta europaea]|uniref:Uncharacterized protein n=1 Tax=Cuscuta europaea TaxID=41803 RepID=A0A9P0ZEY8_CUSEU|nr:unnamed protein product [Cuscuta europaea]